MTEDRSNHIYFSASDSPVPLPPIEAAWEDMRRRLDESMPEGGFIFPVWGRGGKGRKGILPGPWLPLVLILSLLPLLWLGEADRRHGRGGIDTRDIAISDKTGSGEGHTSKVDNGVAGNRMIDGGTVDKGTGPQIGIGQPGMGRTRIKTPLVGNGMPWRKERKTRQIAGDIQRSPVDGRPVKPWTGDIDVVVDVRAKGLHPSMQTKKTKPAKKTHPQDSTRILYAAGLQDGKTLPVGGQIPYDLNANLKKDIWADYIPSPYFEYHPIRRIMLRTGIQLNNPQYTESVTIQHKTGPTSGSGLSTQDTTIVVKKLYYFNVPLSVYFMPLKNLYLGSGIQCSNLSNGIALRNNVLHPTRPNQPDTLQATQVINLKQDQAAYHNLKRTDWRVIFEMNYYWKRFTLALQYQQSWTNYVRVPVQGSQGSDRNKSFSIDLRYHIWEKRVRTQVSKP